MSKDPLRGYEPRVEDYLARCETDEEALEVIRYLLRRGELDEERARDLESKIKREGVRSIVERREFGYYLERYYDPDNREYRG
ncbi:DUF2095 family protein [Methanopyrus sp.]